MLRDLLHSIRFSLLSRINYDVRVKAGKRQFVIPVRSGVEVHGIDDTLRQEVIQRFCTGEGTFLDVGVNLGQALLDLKSVQPNRDYLGFEPNPTAVAYVLELIRKNDLADCRVVAAGLGDKISVSTLYRHPEIQVQPSATLVENLRPDNNQTAEETVILLPWDQVQSNLLPKRQVAFVKIDVEGAELEVLSGMTSLLQAGRPPILCEVLPRCGGTNDQEIHHRRNNLCELLELYDYEIYHLESDGSFQRTQTFYAGQYDPSKSWDYLLLPEERPAVTDQV